MYPAGNLLTLLLLDGGAACGPSRLCPARLTSPLDASLQMLHYLCRSKLWMPVEFLLSWSSWLSLEFFLMNVRRLTRKGDEEHF